MCTPRNETLRRLSQGMKCLIRRYLLNGALLLPPILAAQSTSSQHLDTGSEKMMRSPDIKFADAVARSSLAQVELGRQASEEGASAIVKSFGALMVTDYTRMNAELESIAARESMTFPTSYAGRDLALRVKLQDLRGTQFDQTYVRGMVKDYDESIKECQREAEHGQDPRLKEFAAQFLPVLRSHLEKAKAAQAALSGKSPR
jgi:putative membrane protein